MRSELGIPQDAFVFGFVGGLMIDKGVVELADAFDRLSAADETVWLVIVGHYDGAGPVAVRAGLATHPRVRFTGFLAGPSALYQVMDALVLPSYREGLPTVCLEAAAGKPIITIAAAGAIEDGVTGRHVPHRETERQCAAMAELASDRPAAARMGARGRRFVAADFTNARVWSKLQRFLQEPPQSPAIRVEGSAVNA